MGVQKSMEASCYRHKSSQEPQIPKWEHISITQDQFKQILAMSQHRYKEKIKQLMCPISWQIMRYPCKMKCCKNSERENKWAEENLLKYEIQKRGRCLFCRSLADESFIQFDEDKYEAILVFRIRLVRTLQNLPEELKNHWKKMIDDEFGSRYTQEHFENSVFKG